MSGKEIADIIAQEQPFVTAVIRRGYRVEEITYPYDDARDGRSRHTHRLRRHGCCAVVSTPR